tara:strand:+ start:1770 stop:2075 length:306 start_codon:yes stop_codon:yes gene_type:complete
MESKNPPHYKDKAIQTCDAIMSQMTPEENIGFLRGSAMKYLSRFGAKGGQTIAKAVMDSEKSNWFTQKLINYLKSLEQDDFDIENTTANVTNLFEDKKNDT